MELGWKPGLQGMLLFGQQDPGGPSFAQVTMSIKRQTWPVTLLRCYLPPQVLYTESKQEKEALSPWGTFVQMFRDLLSLNNTLR